MKVFLDTNVLVSAFATRGLCADLYRHVLLEHELLVGEVVVTELKKVLRERIGLPAATIADIEKQLREHDMVDKPRRHLALGLRDADDEWIVASAASGAAEVLVTGDGDLLDAADTSPVRIVTPRQLWEELRATERKT